MLTPILVRMIIRWIQPPVNGRRIGNFTYNQRMVQVLKISGVDAELLEAKAGMEFPKDAILVLDGQLLRECDELIDDLMKGHDCIYMMHLPYMDQAWNKGIDNAVPVAREMEVAGRCKALITTGRFVAEWAARTLKIKVWLLEPGLDPVPTKSEHHTSPKRFLSVASWSKRKGQLNLLKALKEVKTDWTWTIIGAVNDEGYKAQFMSKAREYGFVDRIQFMEELTWEAVVQEMLRHDAFINAPHFETFGMALAEAFATGLPIWTTATGWLMDREAPLGVKFAKKESLAEAVADWDLWVAGTQMRTIHFSSWDLQGQTFKGLIQNMLLKAKL